jgi:hypothetical protein
MEIDEPRATRIVIIETHSEIIVNAVLRELGATERGQHVHIEKIEHLGDINNVSGQAGAVGSHSKSKNDSFLQISGTAEDSVDLASFAAELEMIRIAMKQHSGLTPTAEQDDEIGHVARAQIAAQKGDHDGVLAHLKQVGIWTWNVAKETGAEIVALTLAHMFKG